MKSLFIAGLCLSTLALGFKDLNYDMPMELDAYNFYGTVSSLDTKMLIGDTAWFIEFYAPWCPHCQKLAPTWDTLYRRNKEKLNVARVDCTSKAGEPVCIRFGVKGFPTLLYFPVGQKSYHTYHGDRTVEAFEDWVFLE